VVEYRGFRDDAPAPVVQREHPSASVPIIIDVGAGWRVGAPAARYVPEHLHSFVAGMHDAYALVEAAGPSLGVQVDLSPLGARRLLGVPMGELANRAVPLQALLGPETACLEERLAGATAWPERFAVIDAALTRRLEGAAELTPGVEWAWTQLEAREGAVTIGALAADLGWSRKRMAARFRDEVGLTPKSAARVLRFQALLRRLRSGRGDGWADLALASGYFDQSHLVRDVRRFTGLGPTELLASLAG
jgi:AraC-like DNA-binding protein